MKIKEIRVALETTVNTGNYENMKPSAEVTLLVEDGDDVDQLWAEGWECVTDQIKHAIKEIRG